MRLSDEWIEFLKTLKKTGTIPLSEFSVCFKNKRKAEKSLGEIIRQGYIDLDLSKKHIVITKKGEKFIETFSEQQ